MKTLERTETPLEATCPYCNGRGVDETGNGCHACADAEAFAPSCNAPSEPGEPQTFAICDERSANWLLRKLANLEAEEKRVKAQAETILRQLESDRERLLHLYGQQLEAWAREELRRRGGRRKSLTLLQGTCAFRTLPQSLKVTDEAAALAHCRENFPAAIQTVERLDKEQYRASAQMFLTEFGVLLPGVDVTPERDGFSVRFKSETTE